MRKTKSLLFASLLAFSVPVVAEEISPTELEVNDWYLRSNGQCIKTDRNCGSITCAAHPKTLTEKNPKCEILAYSRKNGMLGIRCPAPRAPLGRIINYTKDREICEDFDNIRAENARIALQGTKAEEPKKKIGIGPDKQDPMEAVLSKYQKRSDLFMPLMQAAQGLSPFDKETLYGIKGFDVIQKLPGGYVLYPRVPVFPSGNTISVIPVFLKTNKNIEADSIIHYAVVTYAGDQKFTDVRGFDKTIPTFEIPANLKITVVKETGPTAYQEKEL